MKKWLIIPLILIIAISGCVSGGSTGMCKTNHDDYSCSGSISNGEITLSLSPTISGASLGKAYLSSCEITGSLWSCSGRIECEVISAQQPFKVRCPVSSGAYAVTFKFMKTVEPERVSSEPFVRSCDSTPEGKFNCELTITPTFYFKI